MVKTIQKAREETRCRHFMDYSPICNKGILYAPSWSLRFRRRERSQRKGGLTWFDPEALAPQASALSTDVASDSLTGSERPRNKM